jgi:hypothetical protein
MENKDSGTLQFTNKVQTAQQFAAAQVSTTPTSYMDMIANAVTSGASIEALERLMALKERHDKEVARQAFQAALAEFQEECPDIRKTKKVEFTSQKTSQTTSYHYAPLPDIDRQIKPLMKKHGFTKRWEYKSNGSKIKVTCILTHTGGHSEQTEMEGDADMSGAKNAIQGQGSAITFMKRYTLEGALGLTTADQDIDGRLPEVDVDKLHEIYMEVFNKFPKDYPGLEAMRPENWKTEKTGKVYGGAITAARKRYADLVKPD